MTTTPPPADTVIALRAWLRATGHAAVVVQRDDPAVVPVAPLRLCAHCRLPIGPSGRHGPCETAQEPTP